MSAFEPEADLKIDPNLAFQKGRFPATSGPQLEDMYGRLLLGEAHAV